MILKNILIDSNFSIREAVKVLDKCGLGYAFILNSDKKVSSVLTDGDFRRAILKGVDLDDNVEKISNNKFISVKINTSEKIIINKFLDNKINFIPVLDNGELVSLLFRKDYNLKDKIILPEVNLEIPVVIMAGGKGTRMAPFTNVFPKPLVPLGDKSMLEIIMDEYVKFGFNDFNISINYKGDLIKAYFKCIEHSYNISYIEEKKFLGTAGALKLSNFKKYTPIFISNCDILIKDDYVNILNFHKDKKNDLTIVAAMSHLKIPYGVCKIKEGGELIEISEKPEYDHLVNTGMYVINSSIIDLIPENEFFHITHLIEKVQKNKGKVGVYPISEKSWIDVGQWKEYNEVLKDFS